MGRGSRPAALCDQRAELRPLQNLRYQRPQPEHHLDAAGRRRWPELSEYVIGESRIVRSESYMELVAYSLFATHYSPSGLGEMAGASGTGSHAIAWQSLSAPAPILPPLGPTQRPGRER